MYRLHVANTSMRREASLRHQVQAITATDKPDEAKTVSALLIANIRESVMRIYESNHTTVK